MENNKVIAPNFYRNFVIAKTSVPYEFLAGKKRLIRIEADAVVQIPAGTSLYFAGEGNSLTSYRALVEDMGGSIRGENICKCATFKNGSGKSTIVNLYWVKKTEQGRGVLLTVPWGFGADGTIPTVNGAFLLKVNSLDEFVQGHFDWDRELSGGLYFDYLSEYFIDRERRQNGVSIQLRDELLYPLHELLGRTFAEGAEAELKARIAADASIAAIFSSYGLQFAEGEAVRMCFAKNK